MEIEEMIAEHIKAERESMRSRSALADMGGIDQICLFVFISAMTFVITRAAIFQLTAIASYLHG